MQVCLLSIARVAGKIERKKSVRQQCANVYQIEKDVMYLNLIYVYLVTGGGEMPFRWETNSIWQFIYSILQTAERSFPSG